VRLILGELTLVLRDTSVVDGAHLNGSPTLPELLVPPLPENVMVSGLTIQTALDEEVDPITEAYDAPRIEIKAAATSI
jgi:hypothetical protein